MGILINNKIMFILRMSKRLQTVDKHGNQRQLCLKNYDTNAEYSLFPQSWH